MAVKPRKARFRRLKATTFGTLIVRLGMKRSCHGTLSLDNAIFPPTLRRDYMHIPIASL